MLVFTQMRMRNSMMAYSNFKKHYIMGFILIKLGFPGGKMVELSDRTMFDTASRETVEEIRAR